MKKWHHSIGRRIACAVFSIFIIFGMIGGMALVYTKQGSFIAENNKQLMQTGISVYGSLSDIILFKTKVAQKANEIINDALLGKLPVSLTVCEINKDSNGAFRSDDGYSAAFASSHNELTEDLKAQFNNTRAVWNEVGVFVRLSFLNCWTITDKRFIRITPKDWALEITSDHNFFDDIFYDLAAPEKNPDRKQVWTPAYYDSILKSWMTSVVTPMYDGDRFFGVTGADLPLDDFLDNIKEINRDTSGIQIMIFDKKGHIVIHPAYMEQILGQQGDMSTILASSTIDNSDLKLFISKFNKSEYSVGKLLTYSDDGSLMDGIVYEIEPLNWCLVAYQARSKALAVLSSLQWQLFGFAVMLAFLIGVIIWFLIKVTIISRIKRLSEATVNFEEGKEFDLKVAGDDEISYLSNRFVDMSMTIKTQITNLQKENKQRHLAEISALNKEEHLRVMMDSIGDAVIATDIGGKIISMNPSAFELTGWSLDEARNKSIETVLAITNAISRGVVENPVRAVLASGKQVGLAEHALLTTRKGIEKNIADSAAPILNSEGELQGVVLVVRDVTREYHSESERRHSQKMESVGQLAGGIAHDFNNMLGGIIGAAEMLKSDGAVSDDNLSMLDMILDTSGRLAALTGKLLSFSRKAKVESKAVDLFTIVKDAESIINHSFDKNISISIENEALNTIIMGDSSEIQGIFLNLGINARDAMPKGGELIFRLENKYLDSEYCDASPYEITPGDYLRIKVSDTGVGIKESIIDHIFDPFFTTKSIGKGTGLGLAAVYGTVVSHNGYIKVDSEVGEGTNFYVYLPVIEKTVDSVRAFDDSIIFGEGLVLVVEDEDVVRVMLEKLLLSLGYTVLLAIDGEDGVSQFREHKDKIDLVLLDVLMPKMNGFEVFKIIKNINADTKIVMSSGFTKDNAITQLFDEGLVGFIKKPFGRAKLSQVIDKAMKR